jgi:spermidine synthase
MAWYFLFFFISGFCSVLYELIWLRLSMAQFGVTTALTSIVLSAFMAGLGAGSWGAGVWIRRHGNEIKFPPLRLYAFCELLIGISALIVPAELLLGSRFVAMAADKAAISSGTYYLLSGACLAVIIIPWCTCMGATIPLAMFAIRSEGRAEAPRSFSFLYVANVFGAIAGTVVPLILIELYGFRHTLRIGAAMNAVVFLCAILLSLTPGKRAERIAPPQPAATAFSVANGKGILALLFATGLATMGMEVIWIRLFTPFVGPMVYSFAMILGSYLLATIAGSQAYRRWSRTRSRENSLMWISLALLGLLPLLTSDVRVPLSAFTRVFLGVAPFAGVIGFLTPMLVDRWSGGDPDRAGRAYAVNVVGCILGPLVGGFLLLPVAGERLSMLFFVLPWFVMAFLPRTRMGPWRFAGRALAGGIIVAALCVFFFTEDYETRFVPRKVLRDNTATVIATGEGMNKRLLTNGVGMTSLTPITKMMVHLTLASLPEPPRNVLVICFGMGTSFRSALSWGVSTTVVELVPSVPKLFVYYYPDDANALVSPLAHVVVDDGRRYLERSPQMYDAIILDPPPPFQTTGSSLLYSQDFYAAAKSRLRAGGILQQWMGGADDAGQAAVARALQDSFPYVRVYRSVEHWGWHFLASMSPIPERSAAELVARMPASAIADMMEWGPAATPEAQFELNLADQTTLDRLIARSPSTPALQDDRPINEYDMLRMPSGTVKALVYKVLAGSSRGQAGQNQKK